MTSTELDTADILAACMTHVPVNVRVNQAIAAHRIASGASQGDPEARQLAMFTLRAVILARTPELDDYRAQLDYLTALPEVAWPENGKWSAQVCREATLAAIVRSNGPVPSTAKFRSASISM